MQADKNRKTGSKLPTAKTLRQEKQYQTNIPTAQPWAHERWTAGAAQRGIRPGFITHGVAMGYYDAALPGLLGIRSLPKVEMTQAMVVSR